MINILVKNLFARDFLKLSTAYAKSGNLFSRTLKFAPNPGPKTAFFQTIKTPNKLHVLNDENEARLPFIILSATFRNFILLSHI